MRINIFGGAGCGKSTCASLLFYELKVRGIDCELTREYIKSWCWEKRTPESFDQYYIFAKQLHIEDIVVRQGTSIISDSPLWLQCAYMIRDNLSFLQEKISICKKWDKLHPAMNIFLKRDTPYETKGRYQNKEEAVKMDNIMKNMLVDNNVHFTEILSTDKDGLLSVVLEGLK